MRPRHDCDWWTPRDCDWWTPVVYCGLIFTRIGIPHIGGLLSLVCLGNLFMDLAKLLDIRLDSDVMALAKLLD